MARADARAPRTGSRRRTRVVAACLAALVAAGLALAGCSRGSDFVTRSGASFELGGSPYRFVGFNLYDAAASDVYACSPSTRMDDAALADTLAYIHDEAGSTVVRFWAYQSYTAGGTDFSGVDRFISAATKAGLKVMPVLEDGPGDCSTGKPGVSLADADQGRWYVDGYKKPYGSARLSYRDYVKVVAQHYADEPAVVGWTMVNEAETTARDGANRSVLVDFAKDVAGVIHAADPNHLVTLGTQGNGAPGGSGADFAAIYGQDGLDFTEVHDWNRYGSDTEALPGLLDGVLPPVDTGDCTRTDAKIACAFSISRELGKPIVVGESGIQATDAAGRDRRASLLRDKMIRAFDNGASGYLVWHLDHSRTDDLDVIPSQKDPLFGVLARLRDSFDA